MPALRVLVLSPLLLAAAKTSADPAQALSGRYYRQFPNAFVSGEKYTGEHIVEIVPVAHGAAYFRIHLDYYNGHSCTIYGIARVEEDALVYRDPSPDHEGGPCVLELKRSGNSLSIDDGQATCHSSHCGMRGSFSNVSLPFSSKRPIGYMARLKASREYRWALDEWRTGTPIEDQWKKDPDFAQPLQEKPDSCKSGGDCPM